MPKWQHRRSPTADHGGRFEPALGPAAYSMVTPDGVKHSIGESPVIKRKKVKTVFGAEVSFRIEPPRQRRKAEALALALLGAGFASECAALSRDGFAAVTAKRLAEIRIAVTGVPDALPCSPEGLVAVGVRRG